MKERKKKGIGTRKRKKSYFKPVHLGNVRARQKKWKGKEGQVPNKGNQLRKIKKMEPAPACTKISPTPATSNEGEIEGK